MTTIETTTIEHLHSGLNLLKFFPKPSSKVAPIHLPSGYLRLEAHIVPSFLASAITRLPSELLEEIFLIYALNCPRRWTPGDRLGWDSWIAVTHVCRRWRSVALAFPALWARVTVINPTAARAMFRRSGNLPLDIMCYGIFPGDQRISERDATAWAQKRLTVTMEELHRIRKLEIISTPWSRSFVSGLTWLGRPAPQLRTLALDISQSVALAKSTDPPVAILSLFQASNPIRLRALHLSDSTQQWKNMLPYTLKVLEVTHAQLLTKVGSAWTFNTSLLSALSNVPRLEQLVVADLPSADACHPVIPDCLPSVPLPHLRSLMINSSALPSLVLLNHLILPPEASVRLNSLADEDLDVHTITSLLKKPLCGRTNEHPHESYHTRSFLLRFRETLTIATWTESLTLPASQDTCIASSPKFTANFQLDSTNTTDLETQRLQWSVITEDILEDLPFPHVSTLYVDTVRPFTLITDFRRVFSRFSGVETLCVDGWTTRQLLALLYTTHSFSNDVFFPRLRTLVLRNVHFPRRPRHRADAMQLATLVERVAQRRGRGCALHELVLQGCYNVVEEDIAHLRSVVGMLKWDGSKRIGGLTVWKQEEVPYGMQYPWEAAGSSYMYT